MIAGVMAKKYRIESKRDRFAGARWASHRAPASRWGSTARATTGGCAAYSQIVVFRQTLQCGTEG